MNGFYENLESIDVNIAAFDASKYPLTFITKKFFSLEPTATVVSITNVIGSLPLAPAVWSAAIKKQSVDSKGNSYSFTLQTFRLKDELNNRIYVGLFDQATQMIKFKIEMDLAQIR